MAKSNLDDFEWEQGYHFETVGPYPSKFECFICEALIRDCVEIPCKPNPHILCQNCLEAWERKKIGKNQSDQYELKKPKTEQNEEPKDTTSEDGDKYNFFGIIIIHKDLFKYLYRFYLHYKLCVTLHYDRFSSHLRQIKYFNFSQSGTVVKNILRLLFSSFHYTEMMKENVHCVEQHMAKTRYQPNFYYALTFLLYCTCLISASTTLYTKGM